MPGSKPIVFVKAFLMHCIVTIFILIVKGRKKYFPRDSYPSHRFLTFLPTLAPSDGSAATLVKAKQGQLFCVSHSHIFVFIHIKNMNSFFLSVRFPRMRREVPSKARRKGQGCVHRSEHLIPVSFARFLPLPLVGYSVSLTFTASLCSSKSGSLASRQAGTAYGLYPFLLHQKVIQLHIETQFTPAVILER